MEALITLEVCDNSKGIKEIFNLFNKSGWGTFNEKGEAEYLPIGDKDEFAWVHKRISENELFEMLSTKLVQNEMIGVNLFFKNGKEGITLMTEDVRKFVLSLSINRRLINDRNTDMSWYFNNLIFRLIENNANILSYSIEEYDD